VRGSRKKAIGHSDRQVAIVFGRFVANPTLKSVVRIEMRRGPRHGLAWGGRLRQLLAVGGFVFGSFLACGNATLQAGNQQGGDAGREAAALAGGGATNTGGTAARNAGASSAVSGSAAAGLESAGTAGRASAGESPGGSAGSGGASAGGALPNGGTETGGLPNGGAQSSPTAVHKDAESVLSNSGVTIVSFGGYLNGESFQQDGIVSFNGYQYAAFWNTSRHVVLGRRPLPSGAWSSIEFADYTNTEADAHNTISIGICAADGTLHLAFDHHGSTLHYRKSVVGLATNPSAVSWAAASFSAVSNNLLGNTALTLVTYPRFVSEPGGGKLLFDARIGSSGSGDEYLWEYDGASHGWTSIGRFIDGTGDSINAYPHGLSYGRGSTRLHLTWCWRETPDASSNHDLLYSYSDDNGRTWKNNAGMTIASSGSSFMTKSSPGIKVWTINQNRGLINQEHMAVDAAGRVHVLLSHLPDAQADDASFDSARSKSQYFHYLGSAGAAWTRSALGLSAVASFRGKLAISASDNLYAVLPDLRIAASSAASNYATWKLLDMTDSGRFFSDPLIDTARLLAEDKLSIFYPQKSSANLYVLDYSVQ
jgi:BNR repeat-containing family member